jgi:hypothetical protein
LADLSKYPGVAGNLDDTLPDISVAERDGGATIVVTQSGDDGGMQSLFRRMPDDTYTFVTSDTVLDFTARDMAAIASGSYTAASTADHASVAAEMIDQVGRFSSKGSPPGQNLACVWAARNIVHLALNRWITHTDGTAVFGGELVRGFNQVFDETDLADGSIVISPTVGKKHGHIGLLGARQTGGDRLIYSNSSAHGVWEQNWQLNRWKAHYGDGFGLEVLFYPIPVIGGAALMS